MDEKLLEALHQYFPIDWKVWEVESFLRRDNILIEVVGYSKGQEFRVVVRRISDSRFPDTENWLVSMDLVQGCMFHLIAESERVVGVSLTDALDQVKRQYLRLLEDTRSLSQITGEQ